jgi:cathepsin B
MSNNPGACVNCNIQNSNPSIIDNSSNNSSSDKNKVVINKRYNPGALLNANVSTNSAISAVQRIDQQTRFDTGASSQQKKVAKTANQTTLNILQNILDVQSDIIAVDKTLQKLRKTARQSSSKSLNTDTKKNTAKTVIQTIKPAGRTERVVTKDQKEKKKQENNQKNRMRNRKTKSVGTDLASSMSFKAKFAVLLQQNIATESATIEYEIPSNFDGRKVWADYISDIRSQGICGSCWAFASIFVLETRLSIYSKGKYNYIFSPSKMVFCGLSAYEKNDDDFLKSVKTNLENGIFYDFKTSEKTNDSIVYGCSGENLINAWQFLFRHGVPENDCFQYGDEENNDGRYIDLTNTEDLPYSCGELSSLSFDICPTTKKRMVSHRAGGFYLVPGTKSDDETKPQGTEYNIRKEIFKWGPCTSGIMVYQDFIDWDGFGVYEYDGISEKIGGHAIVLMGWGEENGKKYWIVRNSWGVDWGDKGYFKILRGTNHCEIEENVVVGFPNIPSIRLFLDYPLLYQKEDFVIQNLWQIRDTGIKETTLEQLALGKITDMDVLKSDSYSVSFFPNFYKFVAGQISKENYKKKDKHWGKKLQNNKIFKFFLLAFLFIILYYL